MGQDATLRRTANPADEPRDRVGAATAPDTSHPDPFSVGDVIKDRYELVDLLGRGGMGAVFLAKDRLVKTSVAIKVLTTDFASHPDADKTFRQEASKAQKLSHDNVVKVFHFDVDEARRSPYIIMEYMSGAPLDDVIAQHPEGRPFEAVWPIVRHMGLGLAYIHEHKLVHCDFKPGNLFMLEDGTVKLLDLGIARATSRARNADTTIFDVGTLNAMAPAYASPEMFEQQPADPRDDIYALGCTVYELLTGKHPFDRAWSIRAHDLVLERVPGLSDRRWRALENTLALKRDKRTSTVSEFLEEFEAKPNVLARRLAAVGLLSALVAGGLAAWLSPIGQDPDQAYLRSLLERAGTRQLEPDQEVNIESWLAQGQDYVGFARDSFAKLDAAGGHRDLRGGADNAEGAFLSVLALTSSETAARGMLQIVEAYAEGGAQFAASDPRTALSLACQGYEMHPNHLRLRTLIENLGVPDTDVSGACSALAQP